MAMNYELSPEQEQYIREQNEKRRVESQEREARRLQRAEHLEERRGEYALLRGEMRAFSQSLSDLNGKFNARRVEIGEIGQAKIDAASLVRKDTIEEAKQEFIDTRTSEFTRYQAEFKAATDQMRAETDLVQEEFNEELEELLQGRKAIVDQIRNFRWD